MTRKWKWLIFFAIVPLLSCIGLLAVQGARAGGERSATQTAAAFLDPLRATCTGQASGVAGAAGYAPGPGIHPIVAFRTRDATTFERDPRVGAGDWAARSAAETQLVACLEESWEVIETCTYDSSTSDGTRYLIRSQHQVKVRLIAARNGETVTTATLNGGEPRACQDTETFAAGATRTTVSGESVTPTLLQPYVAP